MRRLAATVTACAVVALCAPVAGAWKCDRHPERSDCTTTTVPTTTPETTTSYPPVSVSQPNPSTSLPTTTTSSTTVPPTVPPEVSLNPPSVIRLAG